MKRDRKPTENGIVSIQKHEKNYSLIDNVGLRDSILSYKATGLWAFLISHPPDWQVNVNHLVSAKADGRDSVLSGLCELYEEGYLLYLKWRSTDGTFSSRYIVFESSDLKERYLNQMSEDDRAKLTSPYNPKSRTKNKSEAITGNPMWSENEKTITGNPQRETPKGKPEQTNNIYTNDELTKDLLRNSPLTPQGESEWGGIQDEAVLISNEVQGKELTEDFATQQSQKENHRPEQNLDPVIRHSAAVESDPRFLPTDTTADNMKTWNAIVATGAMRGERSPDPEFLEYYRGLLSKCTHYRSKDCNSNHAKSSLIQKWKSEPLKILADAESWLKSKAKFSGGKSTQTRNISELSKDERLAILRSKREQKLGA